MSAAMMRVMQLPRCPLAEVLEGGEKRTLSFYPTTNSPGTRSPAEQYQMSKGYMSKQENTTSRLVIFLNVAHVCFSVSHCFRAR